jgi:hypothetical protein
VIEGEMTKVKKECLGRESYRKDDQKAAQSLKERRVRDESNTEQRKQAARKDNQEAFEFRQQSWLKHT